MSNQSVSHFIEGTSAFDMRAGSHRQARIISLDGQLSENRSPDAAPQPVRGTLVGRPLNMFTRLESVTAFSLCFLMVFATMFII